MTDTLTDAELIAQANRAYKDTIADSLDLATSVTGIVDPTPVSDGIGLGTSLYRGDWFGAVLSAGSMVPYLGDAVAKPVKIGRLLPRLESNVERLVDLANAMEKRGGEAAELAKKIKATLAEYAGKFCDLPGAKKLCAMLGKLKSQADEAGTGAPPTSGGGGGGLGGNSVGGNGSGDFTFRGDARGPEEIFRDGFKPRGTSTDLHDYARNNTPSIYVGTSKDFDVAATFATAGGTRAGNVYTVRPSGGVDVNASLGARSPFPAEREIAIPGGIRTEDIRGVTPLNSDGSFVGHSVLNPGFKP